MLAFPGRPGRLRERFAQAGAVPIRPVSAAPTPQVHRRHHRRPRPAGGRPAPEPACFASRAAEAREALLPEVMAQRQPVIDGLANLDGDARRPPAGGDAVVAALAAASAQLDELVARVRRCRGEASGRPTPVLQGVLCPAHAKAGRRRWPTDFPDFARDAPARCRTLAQPPTGHPRRKATMKLPRHAHQTHAWLVDDTADNLTLLNAR